MEMPQTSVTTSRNHEPGIVRSGLFASACLLVCILVVASAARATVQAPSSRVWAVAGSGLYLAQTVQACLRGAHCGVGDRATDVRLGTGRYAVTDVHVDREGRLYLNQGCCASVMPLVRVGLDGRIDQVLKLPRAPDNVALGLHGEIYYTSAEQNDSIVWKWDPASRTVTRYAGREHLTRRDVASCGERGNAIPVCDVEVGVPGPRALLRNVASLSVDGKGRLLIADEGALLVRRVELDGTMSVVAGVGSLCETDCVQTSPYALSTPIYPPRFVASSRDGSTWFTVGYWLYRVTRRGALRRVFAPDTRHALSALAIDARGNAIIGYWPTGKPPELVRISPAGGVTTLLGGATACTPDAASETCGDGLITSSAGIARQVVSVATARNGDIYFADQGGEIRYIPHPGASPTRLALTANAATRVRRGRSVRIAFHANASATISLAVVGRGNADIGAPSMRASGSVIWHEDAKGKPLPAGRYTLQVIATDPRGRVASRMVPVEITGA
jgi:hypothetical protein